MTHAADAGNFSFTEIAYLVHFCATTLWAGSVIVAVCALRRWAVTASHTPRCEVAFLKRLSRLATVALAVVITTGIGIARPHVGPLMASFFSTPYDRVLILKLALATFAVLLAGCNRTIYLSRMAATAGNDTAGYRRARHRFERTIRIEAWVLAAVLMLASVLGHTSPPVG
jgi:putative copper resistance protein D